MRSEESGTKYGFYKKSIEKVRERVKLDCEGCEEAETRRIENYEE